MSSPEGERLLAGRASKSPNISRANDTAAPKAPSATKKLVLLALVVALILSGVANSVLLKVVRCVGHTSHWLCVCAGCG